MTTEEERFITDIALLSSKSPDFYLRNAVNNLTSSQLRHLAKQLAERCDLQVIDQSEIGA